MTATRRCAPPTTTACSSCHRAASTPARPPSASAGSCRSALDAGIHAGGRPILAWPLALPRPPAGHRLLHLLYALALGVVGGMVFSHFRMPLPWMLGPMSFCAVAAVLGAPLRGPGIGRAHV